MKFHIAALLLFSSFISFSQTEDKDLLLLLDSIRAVDPYQKLNIQINELINSNQQRYSEIRALESNYDELLEFYVRQDLYKKVFDQLEIGVIPDQSELKIYNYYQSNQDWYFEKWSLIQFPESGSSQPIIIYIASDVNTILLESQYFREYPITDLGLLLYNGDSLLKKRYPKLFTMINQGKIIFQTLRFSRQVTMAMQVPKLQFPTNLSNSSNSSLKSKQKYAKDLLSWISNDLTSTIKRYYPNSNVMGDYMKIEKKAYSNATIDEKIALRLEYVEFIKIKYKMEW